MTVTQSLAATNFGQNYQLQMLGVYVVTGCDTSTFGNSLSKIFTSGTTTLTGSLTTTATGSLVLGGVGAGVVSSGTPNQSLASNTAWAPMTGSNPVSASGTLSSVSTIKGSSTTGTPGATSFGVTVSTSSLAALGLLEILLPGNSNISAADTSTPTADNATVKGTIPGADAGAGTDTATVTVPLPVSDAGSGTEVATVNVAGAADTGSSEDNVSGILSGGSTLKFGTDAASSSEATAPMVIRGGDAGVAADILQTATVGIQGTLPPGPRIVRIAAEARSTDEF